MEYNQPVVVLARYVDAGCANAIADSWKLSNEDKQALLWLVANRDAEIDYMDMYDAVACGKMTLVNAVNYLALRERWSYYNVIRNETFPALPINGTDLIAAGIKPGPVFKTVLDRLWELYIESGYQWSKQYLIEQAVDIARGETR